MLRAAICDDNKQDLKAISESFMKSCGFYSPELKLFSSGKDLLYEIENREYKPDILLLDIVMSEYDGIAIAKKVNILCPSCGIIYLTSYISYVSDVYETRHSYFLLKSQFEQRIAFAVAKALSEAGSRKNITFKDHSATVSLSAYEIAYLERNLKKTFVCHVSGARYETYTKPDRLLCGAGNDFFIQCHQSFYVNMYEISSMGNEQFILNNGACVPISRSRRRESVKTFYSFISNSAKGNRNYLY